jgi:hypothetical protein
MIGLLSSLVLAWPTTAVTVTTTSVVVAQAAMATPAKPVAPVAAPATAPAAKLGAHAQKDISRHRAMAQAHTAAAQCLESGKAEEVCHKELLTACKGLAIGKYCGMKHEH